MMIGSTVSQWICNKCYRQNSEEMGAYEIYKELHLKKQNNNTIKLARS